MDRFWSKVRKTDWCWEWTGARIRRMGSKSLSYGVIAINGRSTGAHRVAWELTHGPIPEGMWVLHRCDNQGCVNPDHLYLGTHRENTRDAVIRHRMAEGERVGGHRLRDVDVRAVRALIECGFPTERIGEIFGVSGRAIRHIAEGRRWKSVA